LGVSCFSTSIAKGETDFSLTLVSLFPAQTPAQSDSAEGSSFDGEGEMGSQSQEEGSYGEEVRLLVRIETLIIAGEVSKDIF
jgi:hypothetical protein